jgi:hypothetical protein
MCRVTGTVAPGFASSASEWIDANGNSPILDWFDQRLSELIANFQPANRNPMKRAAKPAMNIALAA